MKYSFCLQLYTNVLLTPGTLSQTTALDGTALTKVKDTTQQNVHNRGGLSVKQVAECHHLVCLQGSRQHLELCFTRQLQQKNQDITYIPRAEQNDFISTFRPLSFQIVPAPECVKAHCWGLAV